MNFIDRDINILNLNDVDDFSKLILYFLCGKPFNAEDLSEKKRNYILKIIKDLKSDSLDYEQFNEILLLYNQDRISRNFFNYFFRGEKLNLEILKDGIVKFRGLTILIFGNFKYIFKRLSKMSKEEIENHFRESDKSPENLELIYKNRPNPIISIEIINKENTWYLGYISSNLVKLESDYLKEILSNCEEPEEYEPLKNIILKTNNEIKDNREKGTLNTETYLIWDYIDVYIATSMRKNCDFEETFETIEKIFTNPLITDLNIRYFDPTQSYCESFRDKGLIEGLMLKRAKCTVYMVQENDTFGKDSELASTLAQKKPVIAFIPDYNEKELYLKLIKYPLEYIKESIFIFKAENAFQDIEILNELDKNLNEINELLETYIKEYEDYKFEQPFSLWYEKEEQFKKQNTHFKDVCELLARLTRERWDKRAKTLQLYHPLGMQIDLNTGVANGVLVVRNMDTCVKILKGILTNSLDFEIKHFDEGYTGLIETLSGSLYRIVTDNELLTNSFWNFFYKI